jgi:hypothetical protein
LLHKNLTHLMTRGVLASFIRNRKHNDTANKLDPGCGLLTAAIRWGSLVTGNPIVA